MGNETGIAWTDKTFNPWWGCTKVSRACDGCYAEAFAKRTGHAVWGPKAPRRFFGEKHWNEPRVWNARAALEGRRAKVFCASMADVFEDRGDVAIERDHLFQLIEQTPYLIWQLLTKRPENMIAMAPQRWRAGWPANVWAGTTTETQRLFDIRWSYLREVPATVRFVSIEPMIEQVLAQLAGVPNWVIFGGESGARHSTLDLGALATSVEYARGCGAAVFVKQDSGLHPGRQGRVPDKYWTLKEFPAGGAP